MLSPGFLILSGITPLVKTFLSIAVGYFLAKRDLFSPPAVKGASNLTMSISLPLLIFASVVPAFNTQNAAAIGPLFMVAFVYQLLGFLFGLVIREVCYVPRNFWQGILVVSGLSNWSSLPNAVVMSVTQRPPFNPTLDPDLGVSYVAIFIVAYHLVFFVLGAAYTLSWDYLPGIPQGEAAEYRVPWHEKPIGSLVHRHLSRLGFHSVREHNGPDMDLSPVSGPGRREEVPSRTDVLDSKSMSPSQGDPAHFVKSHPEDKPSSNIIHATSRQEASLPSPTALHTNRHSRIKRILNRITAILTPVTVSLLLSLPVALVPWLKALFVDISEVGGPDWKSPDGRPPLAFLLDTAQFLGEMAIPLALILLGASFARLKIPRPISRLPIPAMLAVTFAKMILLPAIGVFMVQGMVKGGMIHRDAKVEKFVAMFLSGSPAAINQLIVASLYSPDANVDTLAAFLLVQYMFLFFSSSALTAVSLLLL